MSRVCGINRNSRPPPLLGKVGGVQKRKLEPQPEDVNALPMSSEDEDEADNDMPSVTNLRLKPSGSKTQAPPEQSDDSESEKSGRGDIKRVDFSKPSADKTRKSSTRKVNQKEYKKSLVEETDDKSSSSAKRRKLGNKSGSGSTDQFVTREGFAKNHKPKNKYGGKSGASQASQVSQTSRGSQKSQTGKGRPKESEREAVFDKVEEDGFSDRSQTNERPTFKTISRETFSPTKSRNKLKSVPRDDYGTPEKKTKKGIVLPKCEPSSPSEGTKRCTPSLSQDNGPCKKPSSSQNRGGIWDKREMERRKAKKAKEAKEAKEQSSQEKRAKFVIPVGIDTDLGIEQAGSVSSPILSDLDQLSDAESNNEVLFENEENLEDRMAQCPWCGEQVSEQALKEYSKGKRLNVQMQTRFCAKHKKETAMETWRERGYPHIDWDRLEGRLDDHRNYLIRIVDGKQSHFRDILAEKVETGQGRSLKKEGNLNPGYYGPRGCKLMCDYLVEEFGESLKEKATKDRVISGRGSAAFIQSVLVAELAVQLIMEDMDVSAAEAREIMEESKTLGELIHEEV
ncbi:uncharacterized protein FTOL_10264 [Fusarium torulosum]|uniref:Restriction of telomere capping protein 4 n=1 Tax=Fusarium torulosum TaxID=33205 RepID=A0AAE8MGJ8_9HYPO|nr:uncharacterized protein FTOL_10264 [Fusarium torulosum]